MIKEVKKKAWTRFLDTQNDEPWGQPYRAIIKRMVGGAPPITEELLQEKTEEIVGQLFLSQTILTISTKPLEWDKKWDITPAEIQSLIKHDKLKTAPGPDGGPQTTVNTHIRQRGDAIGEIFISILQSG